MDSLWPTRHAHNGMRHLGLTIPDLAAMLADPFQTGQDREGKVRVDGLIRGVRIRIVIAGDDPTVVITVFERRRGREG